MGPLQKSPIPLPETFVNVCTLALGPSFGVYDHPIFASLPYTWCKQLQLSVFTRYTNTNIKEIKIYKQTLQKYQFV